MYFNSKFSQSQTYSLIYFCKLLEAWFPQQENTLIFLHRHTMQNSVLNESQLSFRVHTSHLQYVFNQLHKEALCNSAQ